MRPVLPICLALVLASTAGLHAQAPANAKPAAAPETLLAQNRRQPPVATPIPMTPAPKKKGLLERVFGGRDKKATPAPAATVATPAPATPRPRPKRRPAPAREETREQKPETPDEKPETETAAKEPVKEAAVKKPTKPKSTKTASKEKEAEEETEPKEDLTPAQQAVKDAEAGGDPGAIEKAKYDEVKSRALQDEKILALKEKADAATDEDEGRKALRAYNKALFQKMRTMDSSIRERVDLMEDAVMKRLEPAPAAKN